MHNQNIPGKPARHQGFSPPFSCWQPPAIGDTLNHLGADWSLKRRSKNETRYHRDQATTGHCILKNPPGCLIIACLLIANICSGFHLTKQWIRAPHKLVWSSDFSFSCCVLILYILTLAIRTPRKFFSSIANNTRSTTEHHIIIYIHTEQHKEGGQGLLGKGRWHLWGEENLICDFGHNFWIGHVLYSCSKPVLAKMKSCFEDLRSETFQWGKKGLFSKKKGPKKDLV